MAPTPRPASSSADWARHLTDRMVDLVDSVRDKTTSRIELVARVLVYGVVLLVLGAVVIVIFVVGGLRAAYVVAGAIPWVKSQTGRPVWFVDLLIGLLLFALGLALQRKGRRPRP